MKRYNRDRKRSYILLKLLLLLVIILMIRAWFVVSIKQTTDSMSPTVVTNDRLYSTSLTYGRSRGIGKIISIFRRAPAHGDLVLLYPPYSQRPHPLLMLADGIVGFVTFQLVNLHDYQPIVRRIIALGGEQVYMNQYVFYVRPVSSNAFVNEFELTEKRYETTTESLPADWDSSLPFSDSMALRTVPPGTIFVAADNRNIALDSRHWQSLPENRVVGTVFVHVPALSRLQIFN